jgi:hypothetical protein
MEGEWKQLDKETKTKMVKVLARAAYDEDFCTL